MGIFDSIFGTSYPPNFMDRSGPDPQDMKRRVWNPLLPRPLYDWEKVVDGKVVNKDTGKPEGNDPAKLAAERAPFMPPPDPGKPVKKPGIFDRILSGLNTGQ